MKTNIKILVLSLICLVSYQAIMAQSSFSNKYTDIEIDRMVNKYEKAHSKDIKPTTIFEQRLSKDFPKAKYIKWETAINVYEAEFEIDRIDHKAYYDKNANLIAYLYEISESALPAIVKNAAQAKYPNYEFEDIKKVIKQAGVQYIVEMEKKDKEVKAIFKENGTFVKVLFD